MAKLTRGVNCAPGAVCWHNSQPNSHHTVHPSFPLSPQPPPPIASASPRALPLLRGVLLTPGRPQQCGAPSSGAMEHTRRPRGRAIPDDVKAGARSDAERRTPFLARTPRHTRATVPPRSLAQHSAAWTRTAAHAQRPRPLRRATTTAGLRLPATLDLVEARASPRCAHDQ